MNPKRIIEISPSREVVKKNLAEIREALIQAESLLDIKRIVDVSAILAEAAKKAHLSLETVNQVQEIRLEAEIKLGHELKRAKADDQLKEGRRKKTMTGDHSFNLSDYGILPRLSMRAQEFAKAEKQVLALAKALLEDGELSVLQLFSQWRRTQKRKKYRQRVADAALVGNEQPTGPFDVILADPPWQYDYCETPTREIENQYETLSLEEICEDVPDAAASSALFLWTTVSHLRSAFAVLDAWDFDYKTNAVWDKQIIGMGYWFRVQHEHLLVGVRGDFEAPPDLARVSSVFSEKRREHSRKPDVVYQWIETAFPGLRKLEMYARNVRPGWAIWGNEVIEQKENL